jgi:thymidylate kinase
MVVSRKPFNRNFYMREKIFTVGFEGMHRAGKSTQIEMLTNKLDKAGIPCISIRGEGFRRGSNNSPGDPESDFWKRMSEHLDKQNDLESWNEASHRLARELVVWKHRILSKKIEKALAPFGVLLVDRSLISRAILSSLQLVSSPEKIFSSEDLYPKLKQSHKKITTEMVLPDFIIELIAPKDVLISRLDKNDPYYEFRKNNIESKYELYLDAKKHLADENRNFIVTIDSSADPDDVQREIIRKIKSKFPELNILR